MTMITNQFVNDWVKEMAELTKPEEIIWIDGSDEQLEAIKQDALATKEMLELNQEKLPGCLYYRTKPTDVARDEKRTVICTRRKEDAGPTNNWVDPQEMYDKMGKLFDGSMKGRKMYVIPFSMGVVGTEFSKIGIEITDSIYVVLSMAIMTHPMTVPLPRAATASTVRLSPITVSGSWVWAAAGSTIPVITSIRTGRCAGGLPSCAGNCGG